MSTVPDPVPVAESVPGVVPVPIPVTRPPRVTWLGRLRNRVRQTALGRLIWRVVVTVVGVLVIAIGIVLLPLPGPGWLIIFAGLGVLATEYTWAARLLGSVRRGLSWWRGWMRRRNKVVRVLVALVMLIFLVAILVGCWYLYKLV